jgi:hypothetical protein
LEKAAQGQSERREDEREFRDGLRDADLLRDQGVALIGGQVGHLRTARQPSRKFAGVDVANDRTHDER